MSRKKIFSSESVIFYGVIAVVLFLMMALQGCSGGGSQDYAYYGESGGNGSSQTTQVTFLPNGTAVLPDGTQIRISSQTLTVDKDRRGSVMMTVSGPTSLDQLGIQVQSARNSNASSWVRAGGAPEASLSTPAPNVGRLVMNATGADQGTFTTNLIATALPGSPIVGSLKTSVSSKSMIKASYVQLDATGSLSSITGEGVKASTIIIFCFADPTSSSINTGYLSSMKSIINQEAPGTINLLSIGGQTVATISDTSSAVNNISSQISSYNSSLTNGIISGVDLDLENSIPAATITALAKGFKTKGLLVSVAPQVYTGNGANVDSSNPTNLVLTSGGAMAAQSTYTPAIASGYVDYVFAQTYNSGGWTIDTIQENSAGFFKAAAKALNNCVKSDTSAYTGSTASACIPVGTYVVVGEPSNAGASGTVSNIFASNGSTSYSQSSILSSLKTSIDELIADPATYPYYGGVMMWSLNNDYMPSGWGDSYAAVGGFSTTIYKAGGPSPATYFILQITNTSTSASGTYPYASASLVINGATYVFGAAADVPLAPNSNQMWGTLASSQSTANVIDSSNLDTIFSNATSFTTSSILLNAYKSGTTNIYSPDKQTACTKGVNYKFEAGHSYNIMINPATGDSDITQVN
ncbi:MAG: glycoside hydrolase family 18 protein [Candidatus Eremiobacteraeota bacterium]|nr:glycoside hydrolase family 18 protein [Candidatus Eremiobacteraeota bacterium]